MEVEIGAQQIIAELSGREADQDKVISEVRKIIRDCANSIKLIHAGKTEDAKKLVSQIDKKVKALPKTPYTEHLLSQLYQEIVEAKVLLAVIQKKPVPSHTELGVDIEVYLTGLCDVVGELRRQMLEELKAGKKQDATYYFDVMSGVYEASIPIRFSNSILPNFRKKQDVARIQVEQARSELLRHLGQ